MSANKTRKIKLTRNSFALVDLKDFPLLSKYKWHCTYYGYAATNSCNFGKKPGMTLMHRLILGAKKGEICDHINRNRLDNRRKNLRICSWSESLQNRTVGGKKTNNKTSKYYGVYWSDLHGKWRTRIMKNKKVVIEGGLFSNEKMAAKKYNSMALYVYGEYARLNFQKGGQHFCK